MKKILLISLAFAILNSLFACGSPENKTAITQKNTTVEKDRVSPNTIQVYYFHSSIRCETCVSVDEDTHQYLKDLYPNRMKSGTIIFQSVNIDNNESPDLVKKYKIYGQRLLIIKGDKVVDLTDDAFMYVPTNPDKWKQILKDNINRLIN